MLKGFILLFAVSMVAKAQAGQLRAKYLSTTVWAPNDEVAFAQASNGSDITWTLEEAEEDGVYKYEVRVSDVAAGSRSRDTESDATRAFKPTFASGSGSFIVENGGVVIDLEETNSAGMAHHKFARLTDSAVDFIVPVSYGGVEMLDIVQTGNVAVTGSQCIGSGCKDNEDFGSDTLRLKGINLRIHFEDTSDNRTSFPSQDWRIVANGSPISGSNFFGIENADPGVDQRILTLRGDDGWARLGVGTSNPVMDFEAESANTPTLRLKQNGQNGWDPQTWDVGANEANFFIRDITHGSSLPFRIRPKAPKNSLMIDKSGNVGLGLEKPVEKLHVNGSALLNGTLLVDDNAVLHGILEVGGSLETKTDIETLGAQQALDALLALEPVQYRYKDSSEAQTLGFIAEDVPDLVASSQRKGVDTLSILAALTKVVQEQQKLIEQLSERLESLTD